MMPELLMLLRGARAWARRARAWAWIKQFRCAFGKSLGLGVPGLGFGFKIRRAFGAFVSSFVVTMLLQGA